MATVTTGEKFTCVWVLEIPPPNFDHNSQNRKLKLLLAQFVDSKILVEIMEWRFKI